MKIRNGFVSNSSSTSFTFCFKGKGIKSLCDLILTKYSDWFTRTYDEYHCNALEVVEAIKRCSKVKSEYDMIKPVSIDKIIQDEKAYLGRINRDIEEAKKNKPSWLNEDYFLGHKRDVEAKIKKMESIKEKGLTTVLVIGFGDNHGEVQGDNVGHAMDYSGREIDIDNDDLVVFTEQNR